MTPSSHHQGVVELDKTEIAKRLEAVPSATVFDVLDRHGLGDRACLDHAIRPLSPGRSLAGTAYTIRWVTDPRGREWNPDGLHRISDYFAPVSAGDVVVVDGAGDRACGHWGEMLSTMASSRGGRGVVVDGGTRDSAGMRSLPDWLAFARYTSPIESVGRMRIHDVQVPVLLGGALGSRIPVAPGDWMLGDDDAVLVIPADMVETVLTESEVLEDVDRASRAALLAGEDMDEVFARYRRA